MKNLIDDTQHGFRNKRSCMTSLLDFIAKVIDTNDTDDNKAVAVYLEFQKAVDKVSHERLMVKVYAHGIQSDAARWSRNWLAGHCQRVCINQSYRNWAPDTSGIPECSVLDPLLFLIYTNDLDTNIVRIISKFADDTKLRYRVKNLDNITELQEDINKLVEWANKWQMNFNVHKCSVMHIEHNNMQGNYNMSNQQFPTTDQTDQMAKTNREKLQNGRQSPGVHCPQFQVQKI